MSEMNLVVKIKWKDTGNGEIEISLNVDNPIDFVVKLIESIYNLLEQEEIISKESIERIFKVESIPQAE